MSLNSVERVALEREGRPIVHTQEDVVKAVKRKMQKEFEMKKKMLELPSSVHPWERQLMQDVEISKINDTLLSEFNMTMSYLSQAIENF